jgi:3-oxoacyl-[acyl-carrier-protein] synthase I
MRIAAYGMVCPVGLGAKAACAALRAGIAAFRELPFHDRQNQPIIGASIPARGLDSGRRTRLVQMLALALEDLFRDCPKTDWAAVPLLIGLAESGRPGGADDLAQTVLADVQGLLGIRFHRELSCVLPYGHVSGFVGLRLGRELAVAGRALASLVCGVDSYLNVASLDWLEEGGRLKTEENTDGVIPGEAAAAVLVDGHGKAAGVDLVGLGFGMEAAGVHSEDPLLGIGLADACRAALGEAAWGFHELEFRLSDVTGENYGFKEHALAHARLMRVVRLTDHPLWHPADSIGDTGAAVGIVQMVMATIAWEKAYAPGARAACFTSSVAGQRAVAMLRSSGF